MTGSGTASPPKEPVGWKNRLRTVEAAATAGIVFAVGSSVAFRMLLTLPSLKATDAEIVAFYSGAGAGTQSLVALNLMILSSSASSGSSP